MRKKIVYLGIGFVILGIILVFMGLFVMSDSGLLILSGNYEAFSFLVAVRSIMNWAGIFLSIGGAIAIIYGVYLDEQGQSNTAHINPIYQQKEGYRAAEIEPRSQINKTTYCFQCGAELEGTPNYCNGCGTKLR